MGIVWGLGSTELTPNKSVRNSQDLAHANWQAGKLNRVIDFYGDKTLLELLGQ